MKKRKLFVIGFTTNHWVKLDWPAEQIFVNLDITDESFAADADRAGYIYIYKARSEFEAYRKKWKKHDRQA